MGRDCLSEGRSQSPPIRLVGNKYHGCTRCTFNRLHRIVHLRLVRGSASPVGEHDSRCCSIKTGSKLFDGSFGRDRAKNVRSRFAIRNSTSGIHFRWHVSRRRSVRKNDSPLCRTIQRSRTKSLFAERSLCRRRRFEPMAFHPHRIACGRVCPLRVCL